MKNIFEGYSRDDVEDFASSLQEHGVFPEIKVEADKTGLDLYMIFVDEKHELQASELLEKLDDRKSKEDQGIICPKCGSQNISITRIENENSFISETFQYTCLDCKESEELIEDHPDQSIPQKEQATAFISTANRPPDREDIVLQFRVPYAHFVEAHMGGLSRMMVLLLLTITSGLALYFAPEGKFAILPFFILIAIGTAGWVLLLIGVTLSYKRIYGTGAFSKLVISSHGIYAENLHDTARLSWNRIQYCSDTQETFTLKTNQWTGIVISKDALLQARKYSDFLKILKSKGILKSRTGEVI